MKKNSLSRDKILKSKLLIDNLFVEGKSLSSYPIRLVYSEKKEINQSFLTSFSVSKRRFKRAVDRNRIKRLMREAFRLQQDKISNKKNIQMMWIYTGKKLPEYNEIFMNIGKILDKINN